MTDVTHDVPAEVADAVDEELVRQLTQRARAEGLKRTGEGGLLQKLTKMVVESAVGWGDRRPSGLPQARCGWP